MAVVANSMRPQSGVSGFTHRLITNLGEAVRNQEIHAHGTLDYRNPRGLAILVTVVAFSLVGDGLRAALDPRIKVD